MFESITNTEKQNQDEQQQNGDSISTAKSGNPQSGTSTQAVPYQAKSRPYYGAYNPRPVTPIWMGQSPPFQPIQQHHPNSQPGCCCTCCTCCAARCCGCTCCEAPCVIAFSVFNVLLSISLMFGLFFEVSINRNDNYFYTVALINALIMLIVFFLSVLSTYEGFQYNKRMCLISYGAGLILTIIASVILIGWGKGTSLAVYGITAGCCVLVRFFEGCVICNMKEPEPTNQQILPNH